MIELLVSSLNQLIQTTLTHVVAKLLATLVEDVRALQPQWVESRQMQGEMFEAFFI